MMIRSQFQSARPAWGATPHVGYIVWDVGVSIRAPRVGRDGLIVPPKLTGGVSIRAPRVGRDSQKFDWQKQPNGFNPRAPRGARPSSNHQPTPPNMFQSARPAWGATTEELSELIGSDVSIRAPRVGRDLMTLLTASRCWRFNPRAPRGARPLIGKIHQPGKTFQSARPAWGATLKGSWQGRSIKVSIRAPRVGRDSPPPPFVTERACFNPRAPRGARHAHASHGRKSWCFNPRAPRGARPHTASRLIRLGSFQSARPAWGAT